MQYNVTVTRVCLQTLGTPEIAPLILALYTSFKLLACVEAPTGPFFETGDGHVSTLLWSVDGGVLSFKILLSKDSFLA